MRRLTMVVTGPSRVAANAVAKVLTDGGDPFDVPLRKAGDATNTVAGYWCSWQMENHEVDLLISEFTARGVAAATVMRKGATPAKGQALSVFDGEDWAPEQILAALGLERIDA